MQQEGFRQERKLWWSMIAFALFSAIRLSGLSLIDSKLDIDNVQTLAMRITRGSDLSEHQVATRKLWEVIHGLAERRQPAAPCHCNWKDKSRGAVFAAI